MEVEVNNSPSAAHNKKKIGRFGGLKFISGVLLTAASVLILAVVALSVVGGPVHESKYVKKDGLQAVFLNNGQVYFGNITNLNNRYVRIANVYYLRQSQQPQSQDNTNTDTNNSNLSLVKLGCEVHGPEDEMLVNKEQVGFWENLKTDGQVAKAVAQYIQENPGGQACAASQN